MKQINPNIQNNIPLNGEMNKTESFKWDRNRMGTGIQLSDNDSVLFLRE